ncbi:hypothetical protein RJT34_09131 [Clitoria ternatea]|uniref:Uncharacterized protein n=1 Tax=Clitoria ternatea TaxID=43366 RepID=A0AAN9K4L4_CLITE
MAANVATLMVGMGTPINKGHAALSVGMLKLQQGNEVCALAAAPWRRHAQALARRCDPCVSMFPLAWGFPPKLSSRIQSTNFNPFTTSHEVVRSSIFSSSLHSKLIEENKKDTKTGVEDFGSMEEIDTKTSILLVETCEEDETCFCSNAATSVHCSRTTTYLIMIDIANEGITASDLKVFTEMLNKNLEEKEFLVLEGETEDQERNFKKGIG